jgi:hypothetical protein
MALYLHAPLYDLTSWCFFQGKRRILTETNNIQSPSSETGSRSTTEMFDIVHNGQAVVPTDHLVVPTLSQMISGNIATSYDTHVHELS